MRQGEKIIYGGGERFDSTLAAVREYSEHSESNLLFHDAARPWVSRRIINDVISGLKKFEAVNVAVPSTDSLLQVDPTNTLICGYPNRNLLQRGQSPQAFRISLILKALELARQDTSFSLTDICAVVLKYIPAVQIGLVRGEESNMKLTYSEDISLLETYWSLNNLKQ